MRSTGMIRAVDKMGRVVIPKSIRKLLDIKDDIDSFEIFMDGENVILRKYQPTCIFCDSSTGIQLFGGKRVCEECLKKLKSITCVSK